MKEFEKKEKKKDALQTFFKRKKKIKPNKKIPGKMNVVIQSKKTN